MNNKPAYLLLVTLFSVTSIACDEAPTPKPEERINATDVASGQDDPTLEEPDGETDGYFYGQLIDLPEVPDTLDELPDGLNAVQFEMRLLTAAMKNILQLIGDERLDEIHGQIRQVHPSYELTHQAIDDGLYQPPANADDIEGFVAMDDEFHDDLRALVGAANDDDLQGVTEAYGNLVEGCASCHGQYRFP